MTARITAVAVGALLLFLGVIATAGPGQPPRPEIVMVGASPMAPARPGIIAAASSLNGFERVTSKNGAWARLLLLGSGLLSLGLIARKRLRDGEGDTEKA